jgi:tetratricopeptide (TPR) repeat protein
MAINCSFHPVKAAHFHCPKCSAAYCGLCVSRREAPKYGKMSVAYFCPICNIPAEHMGIGNIIEPFWARLPKFFTYPLQFQSFLFVLIAAILAAFFGNSFIAQLLFFVISTKYAYAVLNTTAQGSVKPPELSIDLFNQDVLKVFKQYALFAIIAVATSFIFGAAGPVGGFIFLAIILLYAPTMLMVLVASNSIFAALNPMVFIPIVNRIGWRYLLMYLFIILLYGAPAVAFHYMPLALPQYIQAFLYFFFNLYYTLIIYHLLGYVLLQYHEEIGFDVNYEYFLEKSVPQADKHHADPKQKLLSEISVLIKNGRYDDALARIVLETKNQFTDDIELSEKYLSLLQMAQKTAELQEHGAAHLTMLVRLGKKAKAITLYNELYGNGSDLKPPGPAQLQIANWLRDRGEYPKARECYVKFIQTNKGHPQLPEAYFSLARILHENSGNTPKAIEIVTGLLKTYPHHQLAPDMSTYLARMA